MVFHNKHIRLFSTNIIFAPVIIIIFCMKSVLPASRSWAYMKRVLYFSGWFSDRPCMQISELLYAFRHMWPVMRGYTKLYDKNVANPWGSPSTPENVTLIYPDYLLYHQVFQDRTRPSCKSCPGLPKKNAQSNLVVSTPSRRTTTPICCTYPASLYNYSLR